jgi:hypothetical protein
MGLWWSEVQILSPRPNSEVGKTLKKELLTSFYASFIPSLDLHTAEKCSNAVATKRGQMMLDSGGQDLPE